MEELLSWIGQHDDEINIDDRRLESFFGRRCDAILLRKTGCGLDLKIFGDPEMYRKARIRDAVPFFFDKMLSGGPGKTHRVNAYFVPLLDGGKHLPEDSPKLKKSHVNSGMCVTGVDPVRVFIFRIEEARKVFFHEMLHACNLYQRDADFPVDLTTDRKWSSLVHQHPWLATCQNGRLRLNEATTEALACALEIRFRNMYSPRTAHTRYFSDVAHSKRMRQMFLDWGDAWGNKCECDTNAIEYYVLKDLIYRWALDKIK